MMRETNYSEPLVVNEAGLAGNSSREEEIETGARKEAAAPPTIPLVLLATALTLLGGSAMAIPKCVKGRQKGIDWYEQQLTNMLILHGVSAFVSIVCVLMLWKPVAENLQGCWHRKKGMEPRYDTVKWSLTQIVAFSHIGLVFFDREWFEVYNTHKEAWLMQTYFFISGFLSMPEPTRPRLQALWRSLVGAYVVNQVGLYLFQKFLFANFYESTALHKSLLGGFGGPELYTKTNFFIEFWVPIGALWYLPNLITSRLVAPFWMELRFPIAAAVMLCTFVLCLNSADFNDKLAWLDMNSWLTMFPFYVLGIKGRRISAALDKMFDWPATRPAALASFLTFLLFCYLNQANGDAHHSFGIGARIYLGDPSASYGDGWNLKEERSWFNAGTTRLTTAFQDIIDAKGSTFLLSAWYIAVGGHFARVPLVFSVLSLFSRKEPLVLSFFQKIKPLSFTIDITALGRRSISNYLMHWYVFLLLNLTWVGSMTKHYGLGKILLVVLICILQSNFWMCKPVYDLVRPIFLAPNLDWLLVERPSS